MEQKASRNRRDLDSDPYYWWLRSASNRSSYASSYAGDVGYAGYVFIYPTNYTRDVPLVCVI